MNEKKYWEGKEYSFINHQSCEYFPCHPTNDPDNFNCLFCYCPLYALGDQCGGNFRYTEKGIKDCTACSLPHKRKNYGYVIGKYSEIMEIARQNRKAVQNVDAADEGAAKASDVDADASKTAAVAKRGADSDLGVPQTAADADFGVSQTATDADFGVSQTAADADLSVSQIAASGEASEETKIFKVREPWLKWAMELQALAQNGLTYVKDVYDKERYERLRELSAEMLSAKTGISKEQTVLLFCQEKGYQTPKIDTRAAIFQDGKILLVHEKNGTWSLPGGWCDVLESIKSNTEKEVREEAGLIVKADRLIALLDRSKHNQPPYPYGIVIAYTLCKVESGSFEENIETTGTGYFALDELPKLAEEKCTREEIAMCFAANDDENWKPILE